MRARGRFTTGPLRPALAASIALPTLMRPVVVDGRVLIDGGATNPLPFDLLRGRADVIVAIDISGPADEERTTVPKRRRGALCQRDGDDERDRQREAQA